ncbi:MAG TPA: class I SAM-dependent methyltransferase [Nitrospira sp.]|nr:class I SAM-dependent methyltransferase [Nitrospira sp.]
MARVASGRMPLSPYRDQDVTQTALQMDFDVDTGLGRESRAAAGCTLCGSRHSRVVCSSHDVAVQRAFLERFYRSRWREQNRATATDRVKCTQNDSTGIVACGECGLLYRSPRPPGEAVAKAYETERYDGRYLWDEFEVQRAWARKKIPAFEQRLARVTKRARPRILEVGSFVGGFLAEGAARGWDMFGIDPGRDVTAFCRGQQLPVFQGTIEEAKLCPASFDAVVIWNTFDQLPDPHALLKQAVMLLRSGGLFAVRVPNGACFDWAMSLRAALPERLRVPVDLALAWNNLLTFPYLQGYSVGQLVDLLKTYGFRLLDCLPDQLAPVPAGHLRWWAALEERGTKLLCRSAGMLWPDDRSRRFRAAPWLEVYFERACADADATQQISLGVVPVYAPLAFEDTGSDCRRNQWDREGGWR